MSTIKELEEEIEEKKRGLEALQSRLINIQEEKKRKEKKPYAKYTIEFIVPVDEYEDALKEDVGSFVKGLNFPFATDGLKKTADLQLTDDDFNVIK